MTTVGQKASLASEAYLSAKEMFWKDKLEDALELFEKAETLAHTGSDHHLLSIQNQGICLRKIQRPRDAIRVFERLLKHDGENAKALYHLSLAHNEAEEYEEAIKRCLETIAIAKVDDRLNEKQRTLLTTEMKALRKRALRALSLVSAQSPPSGTDASAASEEEKKEEEDSDKKSKSPENPSSSEKMRHAVGTLMQQYEDRGLVKGDVWYVVSGRWWRRWCGAVGYDGVGCVEVSEKTKADLEDEKEEEEEEVGGGLGAIDNGGLVEEDGRLRREVREGVDFVLVGTEVWKALSSVYGGGPSIARRVIEAEKLMVDLYPERREEEAEAEKRLAEAGAVLEAGKDEDGPDAGNSVTKIDEDEKPAHGFGVRVRSMPGVPGDPAYFPVGGVWDLEPGRFAEVGRVGLHNVGNTCYMNAAIQCLRTTWPLASYFLRSADRTDLNVSNPLGTGGAVAREFGALVRAMYSRESGSFAPRGLRLAVARGRPDFAGFAQQDSHELLSFVLDGLHEDLNRVVDKPATETPEGGRGRPDDEVAREAWQTYVRRNDSVVAAHLGGLLRSRLECPSCGHVSITFDPFTSLALPVALPRTTGVAVTALFAPRTPSAEWSHPVASSPRFTTAVLFDESASVADVRANCADIMGLGHTSPGHPTVFHPPKVTVLPNPSPNPPPRVLLVNLTRDLPSAGTQRLFMFWKLEQAALKFTDRQCTLAAIELPDPLSSDVLGWQRKRAEQDSVEEAEKTSDLVEGAEKVKDSFVEGAEKPKDLVEGAEIPSETTKKQSETTKKQSDSTKESSIPPDNEWVHVGDPFDEDVVAPSPLDESGVLPPVARDEVRAVLVLVHVAVGVSDVATATALSDPRVVHVPVWTSCRSLRRRIASALGCGLSTEGLRLTLCAGKWHDAADVDLPDDSSVRVRDWLRISRAAGRKSDPPSGFSIARLVVQPAASRIDPDILDAKSVAPSFEVAKERLHQERNAPITLQRCFEQFGQPEVLDAANEWYCSGCRTHVRATKALSVYQTPDVLVLHLKRFRSGMSIFARKIDAHVDFPLVNLDLTDITRADHPAVYDCFGVVNHTGSLSFGHYTAFVNPLVARYGVSDQAAGAGPDAATVTNEQAMNSWLLYDDSHVRPVRDPQRSVVTSMAYILFYRRRAARME